MVPHKKETAEERKARLARALRANLRRRKTQARDRVGDDPAKEPTDQPYEESKPKDQAPKD